MWKSFNYCEVLIDSDEEGLEAVFFPGELPFDFDDVEVKVIILFIKSIITEDISELLKSIQSIYLAEGHSSFWPIRIDYMLNENGICYLDDSGLERNVDYLVNGRSLDAADELEELISGFRKKSATTCRIIENMISSLSLRKDDNFHDLNKS